MPHVDSFEPGNFCWFELGTSDWKAARQFYTQLFGWTTEEMPMGPDQPPYVMLKKGSGTVGALSQSSGEHAHPAWLSYISVRNVDESAKKAKELGATLINQPFDVMDAGRMCIVQDPQGAVFALWQPKRNPGASTMFETGAFGWNELSTNDLPGSKKFYTSLFGWGAKESPEYTEWKHGGREIGGMMKSPAKGVPPHWLIYWVVDDCDGCVARAKTLGGQAYLQPMDIPNVGRFAVIADPQGAVFAIIQVKR